ncbi:MAG: cyclic nucleotide-binding domain-containing protein [Thiohalocapsa sp. PB-PSB1]|jgi:CRP/FNR family cyclic AMP-dependent transcriptional regulator|nr:MAG: hypothetical protein N838_26210 [Thiohalocapsa sp. PB-PSB1]QQO52193.1 MAG: cyclic nucleotide-binding domain-containing protein [Thiohalocapsa sp. PB-PSB1]
MSTANDILTNPELVELGIAAQRHYEAGEPIIVKGADDRHVYLILSGLARVSERIKIDGAKHIQPGICDLGEGAIVGELSLYEAGPRSASVIAIEPCDVLVFDAVLLSEYLDNHPEQGYLFLKGLFAVLNARLRHADRRFGSLLAWGLKAHGLDQHL